MRSESLRFTLITAVLLCTLRVLAAPLTGTWTASVQSAALQLDVSYQRNRTSLTLALSLLPGLDTTEGVDTRFQLVREAGSVSFTGRFLHGEGAGHFQFEPSTSWREEMAKLGPTNFSDREQLMLALLDVGPTRLRALAALGYSKLTRPQLLQVALFQVTPEFVQEIREAGYSQVTLEQLVQLRVHAIDARYIRSLSTARGRGR